MIFNPESTRFPTRKPTTIATKPTVIKLTTTTKPNSYQTVIYTTPSFTKPPTIASSKVNMLTTLGGKFPLTTEKMPSSSQIPTKTTIKEEISVTTETVISDGLDETTVFKEINDTENVSSLASSSSTESSYATTNPELNSTIELLTTETSLNTTDRTNLISTEHPAMSLTTILAPSYRPEYEKLPTINPMESKENVTYTTIELLPPSINSILTKPSEPSTSTPIISETIEIHTLTTPIGKSFSIDMLLTYFFFYLFIVLSL